MAGSDIIRIRSETVLWKCLENLTQIMILLHPAIETSEPSTSPPESSTTDSELLLKQLHLTIHLKILLMQLQMIQQQKLLKLIQHILENPLKGMNLPGNYYYRNWDSSIVYFAFCILVMCSHCSFHAPHFHVLIFVIPLLKRGGNVISVVFCASFYVISYCVLYMCVLSYSVH